MNTLIIYDSFFGNTKEIALAMGNVFENSKVIKIDEISYKDLKGTDLLIAGSPTRAFNPTKAMMKFLRKIPGNALSGVRVAAFDTRMDTGDINVRILEFFIKIFGYAAKPIGNKLSKKGGRLAALPEGFFIKGSEGPLKEGEDKRAAVWAEKLKIIK